MANLKLFSLFRFVRPLCITLYIIQIIFPYASSASVCLVSMVLPAILLVNLFHHSQQQLANQIQMPFSVFPFCFCLHSLHGDVGREWLNWMGMDCSWLLIGWGRWENRRRTADNQPANKQNWPNQKQMAHDSVEWCCWWWPERAQQIRHNGNEKWPMSGGASGWWGWSGDGGGGGRGGLVQFVQFTENTNQRGERRGVKPEANTQKAFEKPDREGRGGGKDLLADDDDVDVIECHSFHSFETKLVIIQRTGSEHSITISLLCAFPIFFIFIAITYSKCQAQSIRSQNTPFPLFCKKKIAS